MNEIDLIPAVYRKRRLFNRWMKQSVSALLAITLVLVATFVFLRFETEKIDRELQQLQSQKAISTQQREELERHNTRKNELTQQLNLLAGLRSGSAAEQMFLTIDRALSGNDVWFTQWNYRRAGAATEKDSKSRNSGYFIVIPKGKKSREETWMIETQMTIQGEALDHAALSKFVSNLIDQPEIQQVRVVRTDLVLVKQTKLVRFSLDVVVAAGGMKS